MLIGFGWRALLLSIVVAVVLTMLFRMAGCNALII